MEQELRRALQTQAGVKCSDAALLTQLSTAASSHGLAAKEVASRLGAYMLNQKIMAGGALSGATVDHFLSALARECNKENQGRGAATPGGTKWDGAAGARYPGLGDSNRAEQQGPPSTPITGRTAAAVAPGFGSKASPATPQSVPRSAFKARTNRAQVVSTLNRHIPRATGQEARLVHAEPRGVQLPQRHLYLMERLEDKVAAINARISGWRKALAAALAAAAPANGQAAGNGEAAAAAAAEGLEIAPVGVPVQEDSYFVGRIVCEVEGGHLNDTAVVLEGDTATSEGARAALDLSQLSSYRLFPGQVVAVKGVSPNGSRILAKHIWTHLPPPCPRASSTAPGAAADAMKVDGLIGGGSAEAGLSAVVAAGPYCIADDLAYDPLHEMLTELKASPPQMLVLLGPFVDVEQPLISGGMIDVTFQQLFQTQVVERLQAWQAALPSPCQVVLLPAVRDAFHDPTFPQPAIDLQAQDQQLVSLQNPCSFAAGPALLAAVTHDVLRPLSSAELARVDPAAPADRLGALASHVIGQRRFFPLYPAPPGSCLDLTADAALQLQQLPDLLLLPSDLAAFAKTVAAAPATTAGGGYQPAASPAAQSSPQVVVINPGRLAKGSSGGTYAHIIVAAGSGSLASRCRVDIVRV
ncbi:hypothetical protein OEZ85_007042 [Tetradesmus obliquus]|uniref:DNA polymerase alpha subunit B n=1 Tax=Tetradesmus obliquus TaxID=3088 RepID=A0ABY8TWD4_TETOB|nr:hypothetical protein OEZ85_007042 [Tetradesmus obliquus]